MYRKIVKIIDFLRNYKNHRFVNINDSYFFGLFMIVNFSYTCYSGFLGLLFYYCCFSLYFDIFLRDLSVSYRVGSNVWVFNFYFNFYACLLNFCKQSSTVILGGDFLTGCLILYSFIFIFWSIFALIRLFYLAISH